MLPLHKGILVLRHAQPTDLIGGFRLSEASAESGISYSYLSDVERGRRLPTLEVLDALAVTLGGSVASLLRGLYPWDVADPPATSEPPRDARKRLADPE
ncbi:hypothetical protein CFI00_00890 [Nocardioides sp. S5]|nr:hypothetical protein CFI00_00890 [Nocardioides sp. S5]